MRRWSVSALQATRRPSNHWSSGTTAPSSISPRGCSGSRDEALDSTQNAFVKAYENLASFDQSQRFFSWIYQILRNECLNVLRSRRPSAPLPEDMAAQGSPADALDEEQRRAAVQAALMALPDEQREVVLLRHFTELSYDEIAVSTGVPVKTVKSRLYSARQRLATLLSNERSS